METVRIEQHGVAGMLWVAAWLFTIGFLHLTFWRGVLALLVWPVDLSRRALRAGAAALAALRRRLSGAGGAGRPPAPAVAAS